MPLLTRVLHTTGECSTELRRNAVFILGQRGDPGAAALLSDVARTDPDVRVREAAVEWLPRLPNAPIATIESLLRDTSVVVQRAAVRALMSSDDPRARQSVRGLVGNESLSDNLRLAAIGTFTSEHATADDAAYLRTVYAKTDDQRVKTAIVYAVSRIGGADNEQWLLALAKNPAESAANRATAIERLGRTSMSIADLGSMYDNADSRGMRFQIINILADRKEPAATDKLLEIARAGTDPTVRTRAIDALTRKKDPRTTKLLLDIIDRPSAADERKP
jgi:HEAT repeat protein